MFFDIQIYSAFNLNTSSPNCNSSFWFPTYLEGSNCTLEVLRISPSQLILHSSFLCILIRYSRFMELLEDLINELHEFSHYLWSSRRPKAVYARQDSKSSLQPFPWKWLWNHALLSGHNIHWRIKQEKNYDIQAEFLTYTYIF